MNKRLKRCLVCGATTFRNLKKIKGIFILECQRCQIGFVNQIQDNKKELVNLYDLKDYRKQEEKFKTRFIKLINIILDFKKKGSVLDVGAGFGLFSSILKTKGDFKIEIIEPLQNSFYLKNTKTRKHKVSFENFLETKRPKYDLILILDVLEHFNNPLENLKKIKSILNKNGYLIIQTPNYQSLMAKICKDWAWWMINDHKYFFSPKSLKLVLKKTGYKIEYFQTYEDLIDFKKNLDGNFNQIKNKILKKIIRISFFLVFIPIYLLFRKLLWLKNYGGLMFVVCKKN